MAWLEGGGRNSPSSQGLVARHRQPNFIDIFSDEVYPLAVKNYVLKI